MSSQFQRLGFRRFGWAEPGFARAQPTLRATICTVLKEGAHGGTLGSPVLNAMGLGGHNACVLIGRVE